MAEPIPTRKEVSDAMEDGNWAGAAFAVAAAYAEGRLVDREAIDYEAVVDRLLEGIPDDIRESILEDMPREVWLTYAIPLVAAAIGDTK